MGHASDDVGSFDDHTVVDEEEMTKKDQESIVIGGAVGVGFVLLAWFMRRQITIPVIKPTQLKWQNT